MKGTLEVIGDFEVEGETRTGVFIACTQAELKRDAMLWGEKVIIIKDNEATE